MTTLNILIPSTFPTSSELQQFFLNVLTLEAGNTYLNDDLKFELIEALETDRNKAAEMVEEIVSNLSGLLSHLKAKPDNNSKP